VARTSEPAASPVAENYIGELFPDVAMMLRDRGIDVVEVPEENEAPHGTILEQSTAPGESVVGALQLTVSRQPLPDGDTLESALLAEGDYAPYADLNIDPLDDRGAILEHSEPVKTVLCQDVEFSSDYQEDDRYLAYAGFLFESDRGAGSEATSFDNDGALLYIRAIEKAAGRCNVWRVRAGHPQVAGADATLTLSFSGDLKDGIIVPEGDPSIDRVYVLKDNVVLQLVLALGTREQPDGVTELAARMLERYSAPG